MSIAIIGAGLSGLTLALALSRDGIGGIVYETASAPRDIGGAIMLSPNALKIMDKLGVLTRLEPRGYKFETLYFRDEEDQPLDEFEFGSAAKYGHTALRVYRNELINVLLALNAEAGVRIEYGKKFDKILEESADGVKWLFGDGSEGAAPMLVGADGIHSRVRAHLYPGLAPKFTNMLGVTAAVSTSQLEPLDGYSLPVTFMNRKHGAFVIAPQFPDGSEVLIGKQYNFPGPEPDREGWNRITSNKAWCIDFLREGSDDFPPVVGRSTSEVSTQKVNLWPFYLLPKLDRWTSEASRVVILGDAAHAIPPTAGQGVNQAFEDVYTFAGLLQKLGRNGNAFKDALKRWQAGRQARIDRVLQVNDQINQRRMPGSSKTMVPFDLEWLYAVEFDEMVQTFAGQ